MAEKSWQSGFNQLQDDSIPENNENICRIQERGRTFEWNRKG